MRKGTTITEVLVMVLIIAAAWGAYSGFLSLRRHWISQGAMHATQIAAQPATETQAEQPEPEETEQALELREAHFKGGSDYWIALKVSRTSTMQMPVKEKLWREISPGDWLDVDVPGGTISGPVVRKYRRLDPAEDWED